MKKIISLLTCALVLVSCTTSTTKVKLDSLEYIRYNKLDELMNEGQSFMLFVSRDDCSDCVLLKEKIEDYIKHTHTGLYAFDLRSYKQTASKKEYNQIFKTLSFEEVPVLLIIENGKIKDRYDYLDEAYFAIKDRPSQIKRRKEIEHEFYQFMNKYYEVNYEVS